MRGCSTCSRPVDESFRYCPWCASPQRLKLVDFFRPHPLIEQDQTKALRVSRYLAGDAAERHVRFSVWDEAGDQACARAAVSIDEDEAWRLARFLADSAHPLAGEPSRAATQRT